MSESYEAPKKSGDENKPAGFYDYEVKPASIRTALLLQQFELAWAKMPIIYDKMIDRGALTKNQLESAEHDLLRKVKKSDRAINPRANALSERNQAHEEAKKARVWTDRTRELSTYFDSTATLYRANVNHLAEDFDRTLVVPKVLIEVEQQLDRIFPEAELESFKTLKTFVSEFKGKIAAARSRFSSVVEAYPSDMRSPDYNEKKETQVSRDQKRTKAMLTAVKSLHKEMKEVEAVYRDAIKRADAAGADIRTDARPVQGKSALSIDTRTASGAIAALPGEEARALARFKGLLEQELINNIRPSSTQKGGVYYELGHALETHVGTGKKLREAEIHLNRMLKVRAKLHETREARGEQIQLLKAMKDEPDDFSRVFAAIQNGETPSEKNKREGWSIGITPAVRPDDEIFIQLMKNRHTNAESAEQDMKDDDTPDAEPEEDTAATPISPVTEISKEPPQPVREEQSQSIKVPEPVAPAVERKPKQEEQKPRVPLSTAAQEKKKEIKEKKGALEEKRKTLRVVIEKLKEEKLPKQGYKNSWADVISAFKKEKLPEEAMQAVQKYIDSQEALRQGLKRKFSSNGRKFLIDVLEGVEKTLT